MAKRSNCFRIEFQIHCTQSSKVQKKNLSLFNCSKVEMEQDVFNGAGAMYEYKWLNYLVKGTLIKGGLVILTQCTCHINIMHGSVCIGSPQQKSWEQAIFTFMWVGVGGSGQSDTAVSKVLKNNTSVKAQTMCQNLAQLKVNVFNQ